MNVVNRLNFNQRLREERIRLGYSQKTLSEMCEISYNAYSNYELGKRSPDATLLELLASLGFDIGYLVAGVKNSYTLEIRGRMLLKALKNLTEQDQIRVVQLATELEMDNSPLSLKNSQASVNQTAGDDSVNNNQVFHASVQEVTGIKK
ncbi:helix-turn-helix domain-containing protein [Mannheimia haemolytica]|uniref:helix-turn-helix domain-containing protein n=1 Tax=Mannheimia haemolytica TaxID=75985 RepID=UPI00295EA647|nr:helix-turn-helix transcriptional regulator [Mannheimia haemolytica]